MADSARFDFDGFITAVDQQRKAQGLRWHELANVLWQQSSGLNKQLADHPI